MELNDKDLYILVSLEHKGIFEAKEVSYFCDIDKSTAYKSIKRLQEAGVIIKVESNPLKYAINYDKLK
jgi:predicted transcriptional regulator